MKEGNWIYEVTQVRARKTGKYGDEYSGIVTITNVNGEAHVEGLLCTDFTRHDAGDIKNIVREFGWDDIRFNRFKNKTKRKRRQQL